MLQVVIELTVENVLFCALKIVLCVCFTSSNVLSHAALCTNALLMFVGIYPCQWPYVSNGLCQSLCVIN